MHPEIEEGDLPPAMLLELLRRSFADVGAAAKLISEVSAERDRAYAVLFHKLVVMTCLKHGETYAHIERVGAYAALLARLLGQPKEYCGLIEQAAPLHDIGKVFIPDSILKKPGPLTLEERGVMELHAQAGYVLLRNSGNLVLDMASNIARSHHEAYGGGGYPGGLAGDKIPLEARITSLVDVFDALISDRVYRKAIPVAKVLETLREQAGKQFDPRLVDVFIRHSDKFLTVRDNVNRDVARRYSADNLMRECQDLSALLESRNLGGC